MYKNITPINLDLLPYSTTLKNLTNELPAAKYYFETSKITFVSELSSYEENLTVFFTGPSDSFPIDVLFRFEETSSWWMTEDATFPNFSENEDIIFSLKMKILS